MEAEESSLSGNIPQDNTLRMKVNSEMDLISVIVPVYKVEPYLIRCVDSIRQQTYQNLEIVLIDDGSPDSCPQMCDALAREDKRIRVVHKENGGLGYARNSGLDVATGDYVVFVDSDDWISKTHIENLHQAAKEHQADVVIGSYTRAFASGVLKERCHSLDTRCYVGEEVRSEILLRLLGADLEFARDVQLEPSCTGNIYRMDIIQEHNLRFFSERYAISEDIYFSAAVYYKAQRVVLVNEVGYFYFENQRSLSNSYDPKMFDRILKFYEVLKSQVVDYELGDAAAFRIERTFLMKVRVAMSLAVTSNLPRSEKFRLIREMLCHPLVCRVLEEYPIHTQETAMRLLTSLMKKRSVLGVFCLLQLREYARLHGTLKAVLNQIRPSDTRY